MVVQFNKYSRIFKIYNLSNNDKLIYQILVNFSLNVVKYKYMCKTYRRLLLNIYYFFKWISFNFYDQCIKKL